MSASLATTFAVANLGLPSPMVRVIVAGIAAFAISIAAGPSSRMC